MDITQVILIVIGLYIIYTYMYKKEKKSCNINSIKINLN